MKLKSTELIHLLNLVEDNKRYGTYYGREDHYWKRSKEIEQKLISVLKVRDGRFREENKRRKGDL